VYGGENRLWIGPEGGRFSVFFKPGAEQVYDNWQTPAPFDSETWINTGNNSREVIMNKVMTLHSYTGKHLEMQVQRMVKLLDRIDAEETLHIRIPDGVKHVAYVTMNTITNTGNFGWTEDGGAPCLWMADMLPTGDNSFTFIPFVGDARPSAVSDYFGIIPDGRYVEAGGFAFLKTDGRYRSKVGLPATKSTGMAANYNPEAERLTICFFDVHPSKAYLSEAWDIEADPLKGEVVHAYNDGPLADGTQMGPFLELESASPAAFLSPRQSLSHIHGLCHFIGNVKDLSSVTQSLFGAPLEKIMKLYNG
jgi:hypothetical protein